MHAASKRSTRSKVTISIGPMSLQVNVFGGVFKPESPKSYCTGTDSQPHNYAEIKSLGRQCPHCLNEGGRVVQAYKADDGALVPISASARAERLQDVSALRDRMDFVSATAADLAASAIDSGNVYWLVPSTAGDEVNYAGLAQAIESDQLNLLTAWASRTVAKLYRLGVIDGLLTLTEMVPVSSMRMAPVDPPQVDEEKAGKAAKMFAMAAALEPADREQLASLALDPGREALRRAANRSREEGAETLKVSKSREHAVFAQRLAEAVVAAQVLP